MVKVDIDPFVRNQLKQYGLSGLDYAPLSDWCYANVQVGNWQRFLGTHVFLFEHGEDALAFKLKFGL
jgi:hypothetical protein